MAEPADDEASADERRYAQIADALVAAVDGAVAGWAEASVVDRVRRSRGRVTEEERALAAEVGRVTRAEVVPALRMLLATDVDTQATTPLAVLRNATVHAHGALDRLGVPPAAREAFAAEAFPGDVYGLVPATWSDVDEGLHEPGLAWGAAKAYLHLQRRPTDGRSPRRGSDRP